MKHRKTKERQQDYLEFVYKHRATVESLLSESNFDSIKSEVGKRLIALARAEMGYSCKTADFDILQQCKRVYSKLIINK